jgi:hypothetical protein
MTKYMFILVAIGFLTTGCPSPEPPKQVNDCKTLCTDLKNKKCKEGLNPSCEDVCNLVIEERLTNINNFAKKCTLEK